MVSREWRKAMVLVVVGVLGLAAFRFLQAQGDESAAPVPTKGEDVIARATPLAGNSRLVSPEEANNSLKTCDCPLPLQGQLPPEEALDQVWQNDEGQVAYELKSSSIIYYKPESLSAKEYEQVSGDTVKQDGAPFTQIPFRGTAALAVDINKDGPASLSWVEGGYLVELVGHGGETLQELQQLVGDMAR